MKHVFTLLLVFGVIGCGGIKTPKVYKPATPSVLSDDYDIASYQADKKAYSDAVSTGQLDVAAVIRNRVIWNMTFSIDNAFEEYSQGIGALRATAGVGSDIVQSGLGATSAIVGNPKVKDWLSVALLGTNSLTSSVKGRYFANVPPEVFIGAMRKSRAPIAEEAKACMVVGVRECPFEQARSIMGRLYWSGTLEGALVYLQNSASTPNK